MTLKTHRYCHKGSISKIETYMIAVDPVRSTARLVRCQHGTWPCVFPSWLQVHAVRKLPPTQVLNAIFRVHESRANPCYIDQTRVDSCHEVHGYRPRSTFRTRSQAQRRCLRDTEYLGSHTCGEMTRQLQFVKAKRCLHGILDSSDLGTLEGYMMRGRVCIMPFVLGTEQRKMF